jgi:hypothetical protein
MDMKAAASLNVVTSVDLVRNCLLYEGRVLKANTHVVTRDVSPSDW